MCETQAIGRVRRYGQQKTVHVYRFLVDNSMDTRIYDRRCVEQKKLHQWDFAIQNGIDVNMILKEISTLSAHAKVLVDQTSGHINFLF